VSPVSAVAPLLLQACDVPRHRCTSWGRGGGGFLYNRYAGRLTELQDRFFFPVTAAYRPNGRQCTLCMLLLFCFHVAPVSGTPLTLHTGLPAAPSNRPCDDSVLPQVRGELLPGHWQHHVSRSGSGALLLCQRAIGGGVVSSLPCTVQMYRIWNVLYCTALCCTLLCCIVLYCHGAKWHLHQASLSSLWHDVLYIQSKHSTKAAQNHQSLLFAVPLPTGWHG
jgi:hypothetical protein